ncbi:MAG: cob(I)yrinic acid a,c-diamide adenosyltransferase [Thermoplasmata archaeon]|nr:cob(I)yrinic acid a,c-diamide adenosyltransferase [Thermoplasmata archaeon]MCI4345041.1 cob(I)yrinic acid a,c-diamide adenosyltransferase [Thermoplasmata archaeon]
MATGGEGIARLYTRTGDRGDTGLVGGARVAKDSLRIASFGAYDELGAQLGCAEAALPAELRRTREVVRQLQHELYVAQSELATPSTAPPPARRIEARHVARLEAETDEFASKFEPVHTFVLPRGAPSASELHVARAVARRAERALWALNVVETQRPELLQWANRLSDLLFAMALSVNHELGVAEVPPDYSV